MSHDNLAIVERYWALHYARRWLDGAALFSPDVHYTDVGVDAIGATGPAEVIARLSALDVPQTYLEDRKSMVASGDIVMTEHVEILHFATGERIDYPFVSVMEMKDGRILRWHDYGHAALFANGPAEWLTHARNWRDRIGQHRASVV